MKVTLIMNVGDAEFKKEFQITDKLLDLKYERNIQAPLHVEQASSVLLQQVFAYYDKNVKPLKNAERN